MYVMNLFNIVNQQLCNSIYDDQSLDHWVYQCVWILRLCTLKELGPTWGLRELISNFAW